MSYLFRSLLTATAFAGIAVGATIGAEAAQKAGGTRRVAIEYRDLSGTQDLSSTPWVSHTKQFRLWEEGKPAGLLIQELAENGNPEFVLGTAISDPKTFLDAAVALPSLPGKGRRVVVKVDAEHPLVSGGWMLGHTNDGFAGIEGVDAYKLTKPMTIEVYALDAGTEKNTEKKEDAAGLGGLGRIPQNGVISRHTGVRGDADIAASFKFDPAKPIGRVTITPLK